MAEKPTLPVGVSVLLTKGKKMLVGRRKNNSGAGLLSTPGGRIELNEDMFQCAMREFNEETGATLDRYNLRVFGFKEHFRFGGHYIMFYIHADKWSGEIRNTEPNKCEGWVWRDIGKVDFEDTTEPAEILVKLFRERI